MIYLQMTRNRGLHLRTVAPGLLLAAIGLGALLIATGQPFRLASGRPGPGFVPMLLAVALTILGSLHALVACREAATCPRRDAATSGRARPGLLLCVAIAAFALLLPWAGFLPAAWAAGSLSLAAAAGARPAVALAGGGTIAGLAAALFLGALGLPTPLIGGR